MFTKVKIQEAVRNFNFLFMWKQTYGPFEIYFKSLFIEFDNVNKIFKVSNNKRVNLST